MQQLPTEKKTPAEKTPIKKNTNYAKYHLLKLTIVETADSLNYKN